jgi:RNA polymerase sigma-70 factor (ECF subfamily)
MRKRVVTRVETRYTSVLRRFRARCTRLIFSVDMERMQHGSQQQPEGSGASHAAADGDGLSNGRQSRPPRANGRSRSGGSDERFVRHLEAARGGSGEAIGAILQQCRNYLLLVANRRVQPEMRAKVAPSDLVQDTFHDAVMKFDQFRGATEAELLSWLARILRSRYCGAVSRYRSAQRREVSRLPQLDGSGSEDWPGAAVVAPDKTPSAAIIAHEEAAVVLHQLTLLPDDLSSVIRLRNFQHESFAEIGRQMNRSADAARKLWARAIEQLCLRLEPSDESP